MQNRLSQLLSRIGCFFVLFCFSLAAYPQNSNIRTIRLYKSKINYTVDVFFQDNTGYIWIGTSEGLVRYDGFNQVTYGIKDSLADKGITAINQDDKGRIWIGHPNGKISLLKNNVVTKFNPEEGLGKEKITSLFCDSKKYMWFTTDGEGVYYFNGKRLYNLNKDDNLADNVANCVAEDSKRNMWIGTDAGLSKYNMVTKEIKNFSMKDGLPDNIVKSIAIDKSDKIWIGMEDGGVCRFDPDNSDVLFLKDWKFGAINNLLFSKESDIWVSTKKCGVIQIHTQNNQFDYRILDKNHGLLNNNIQVVFEDRESNIWYGTNNGIHLFTGDLFTFLTPKINPDFKQIYSFLIDELNNYWFCSENGLFRIRKSIYNELIIENIFKIGKGQTQRYVSLFKDKDGYVWVGTYNQGVYRINPQNLSKKNYTTKNGLANDNVISISGKNQYIWFSTLGGGVSLYDLTKPEQFVNYNTTNGLPADFVYSSFIDSKNRTWFALDGGNIAWLENGKLQSFHNPALTSAIYGFAEDQQHKLYAYTASNGLLIFRDNAFSKIKFDRELMNESLLSVAIDTANLIHIITNDGIQCFNMSNLKWVNTFGEESGVAYKVPNLNALFTDPNGALWIGTQEGLIKYNARYQKRLLSPSVHISSIKLFYHDADLNKTVFAYDENHLSFNFTGIWFTAPENIYYQYKLIGFDLNWSAITQTNTATYSNLPPGKYTFKVRVSNNVENWDSANEAVFSFIIKKPFWKTWWFISICTITVICSLFLFTRLRIKKLVKQKEILENEVQKRTAVILEQKEKLQSSHDIIQEKNKSITDSINYASRIQQAVFPSINQFSSLLGEYFVFYKPKDIVSGDFYWINNKENSIIVTAADCTGHGVPGAFMSILGISLLSEIVNREPISDAATVLNQLRIEIKNSLKQVKEENKSKDGMDIALCILDTKTLILQYAGAYNPLYLIHNGELIEYKADKMPIGIHLHEKESFTNHTIQLAKGDILYLSSDGFVDQTGGPDNRKYLSKNFKKLLVDICQKTMDEQRQYIDHILNEWRGNNEQIDDILVLGIKI